MTCAIGAAMGFGSDCGVRVVCAFVASLNAIGANRMYLLEVSQSGVSWVKTVYLVTFYLPSPAGMTAIAGPVSSYLSCSGRWLRLLRSGFRLRGGLRGSLRNWWFETTMVHALVEIVPIA